ERKLAYDSMRHSQRFLQHIIEISPSLISIYDVQEKKSVFVNRGIAVELGYAGTNDRPQAELLRYLMHPDDWEPFLHHLEHLAAWRNEEPAEFEYRMRHSSGAWRWFHSHDKVFTRSADGSVKEIICTATDITERKTAEEKNRFMADLNEAFLPLAAPEQIM